MTRSPRFWKVVVYLGATVFNMLRIGLNVAVFLLGYWPARSAGASETLAVGLAVVYSLTGEGRALLNPRKEWDEVNADVEADRKAAA